MYTTCHCKSPHRSEPPFCIRDLSFGPNPKNQKNLKMHPKNIAKHQGKPKKPKKNIRVFKITCRRVILASFKFVWYFWVFWVFPRFLQCFFIHFAFFWVFLVYGEWRLAMLCMCRAWNWPTCNSGVFVWQARAGIALLLLDLYTRQKHIWYVGGRGLEKDPFTEDFHLK